MVSEDKSDKILVRKNLNLIFDEFKDILESISEELEQDYIQNKETFVREARNHKWYQLKKDIKSTEIILNRLYSKLIFMLEEVSQWRIS